MKPSPIEPFSGISESSESLGAPKDDGNRQHLKRAKSDFKRRRREAAGEGVSKFLVRLSNEIEDIDREKRLSLFRMQLKAHQYLDGNFHGYVDANCDWVTGSRQDGEVWYTDNQLYPYWRTALMELSRTQTEVIINSNSESEAMAAVAKFAKKRYDAIRSRTFTARLKQTENAYALLNGITFRYTFPLFSTNGQRHEKIPKVTKYDGPQSSEKVKLCAMCQRKQVVPDQELSKVLTDQPETCVNCGSPSFMEIELPQQSDLVIGYEDVARCENAWIVPNPISVIVSMQAAVIEETPFIKWKQFILRSILEEKFDGLDLPSTGIESLELQYITDHGTSTPGGSGSSRGTTSDVGRELEPLEFHQHWIDYPVYCNQSFEEDCPLTNGKTLSAGQKLGEVFPDGLYFAKVGDLIVDMWNEDKNRKWTSSPYGLRPGSMYGSGSSAALTDQELINDLKALQMANAWANGVPREFVDPAVIPQLSSDPNIPTTIVNPIPGQSVIGTAYAIAPPTQLSAEIYSLEDNAKSSMQNKIGALSGTGAGGLQDSQKWGDTATAISIKRDLAVGRFSPDLELMADQLDRLQAYQFLENEQQYFTPQQWDEIKGEYSEEALEAFLKCDLRRDLNITIAPGTWMPKSEAQTQSKFMSFAQILPMIMQAQNPELISTAFEVFGLPPQLGAWTSDRGQANRVVQRFKLLAEEFIKENGSDTATVSLEDPQVAQAVGMIHKYANMPVDVFLDNHEAMGEAYRDLRATDEGREWSNILTAAVSARLLEHKQGTVLQEQMVQRMTMESQAPMEEKMNAEQQAVEEQQAAAAEQQAAADDEAKDMEMADRVVEYNDRDQNREARAAEVQAKMDHEKELKAAEITANSVSAAGQ